MRLWVENAHQHLLPPGTAVESVAVSTLQTQEQFFAVQVSRPPAGPAGPQATAVAGQLAALLEAGASPEAAVERLLPSLPVGVHVPIAVLQVVAENEARLVECDAPSLFAVRQGRLAMLPVLEEESHGRLLRRCEFPLQEGDHLAIVSEGYIRIRGWGRRWGWQDIALSIKRLTDTGCDAEQLAGALVRTYRRLAAGEPPQEVAVTAMHVRPVRTTTVWSGPPVDPAQDRAALDRLLAEPGTRVICGDTTAEIAARLMGTRLEMEPRPADGWADVPPVSRLTGVALVTEGVVTLRRARERLAEAQRARDLPRAQDGATRLARVLFEADIVRFLVGQAVNPAQTEGSVSWRQRAIKELVQDLRTRGKIVLVEYLETANGQLLPTLATSP